MRPNFSLVILSAIRSVSAFSCALKRSVIHAGISSCIFCPSGISHFRMIVPLSVRYSAIKVPSIFFLPFELLSFLFHIVLQRWNHLLGIFKIVLGKFYLLFFDRSEWRCYHRSLLRYFTTFGIIVNISLVFGNFFLIILYGFIKVCIGIICKHFVFSIEPRNFSMDPCYFFICRHPLIKIKAVFIFYNGASFFFPLRYFISDTLTRPSFRRRVSGCVFRIPFFLNSVGIGKTVFGIEPLPAKIARRPPPSMRF